MAMDVQLLDTTLRRYQACADLDDATYAQLKAHEDELILQLTDVQFD